MNKTGPIIIIEDDLDDQQLLDLAFKEINYANEVKFFFGGEEALDYLQQEDVFPFLIISDINMPRMDGMELRSTMLFNELLKEKSIPYLFFSTHVDPQTVRKAYNMSVQGFFLKPSSFKELVDMMRSIIDYWQKSYSPNSYQFHNRKST